MQTVTIGYALLLLVLLQWLPLPMAHAQAGDQERIDDLLDEANRALGGSSTSQKDKEKKSKTKDMDAKPARKSTPQKARPADKSPASGAPATGGATDGAKPEEAALKPIDVERVTEILALDLQAQERERVTRGRGIQVRLGLGYDRVPPVYSVEKDDDTFRIDETAVFTGVIVEAAAQVPIMSWMRDAAPRGAPFWGLTAGAGFLQGKPRVSRRGVTNQDRTYPYQVVAADGGLAFGWSSNLAKPGSAGYQIWLSGGYGADIIRQKGDGHYDTFTEVFHGETAALGASWRSDENYEIFSQIRQRGRPNAEARGATHSKLAGVVILIGLGMPISG
jgi:hypothetical protein